MKRSKDIQPELVLVRGLPGSGKSTIAQGMTNYVHLEADMYFIVNGDYCFDRTKLKAAHDWCVKKTKKLLEQGQNVVVANTFVKRWEIERYTNLGYPVRVIETQGQWQSIHGVPEETIERMRDNWEDWSQYMTDDKQSHELATIKDVLTEKQKFEVGTLVKEVLFGISGLSSIYEHISKIDSPSEKILGAEQYIQESAKKLIEYLAIYIPGYGINKDEVFGQVKRDRIDWLLDFHKLRELTE